MSDDRVISLVQIDNRYGIQFSNSQEYWQVADELSEWCRRMWGDTDWRTNPNYIWRRSMYRFMFRSEGYRTLFLLEWSAKINQQIANKNDQF